MKPEFRDLAVEDLVAFDKYWMQATPEYLRSLGIDPEKSAYNEKTDVVAFLERAKRPDDQKKFQSFAITIDGRIVGTITLGNLVYGEQAELHAHVFESSDRAQGYFSAMVHELSAHFKNRFKLKSVYCEPSADNPAPNKLLQKLGFKITRNYFSEARDKLLPRNVNRYEIQLL